MVQRTTQGTPNPVLEKVEGMKRDLTLREAVVVTPLIVLILLIGFYPKPVVDIINPAVKATLTDIKASDPAPTVASREAGK
jgi:NADH-quinone oxidoreductase subunit M